ncbi:hypothetical protein [Sphingomonas paeninsulae]|uniref:hypothetical protein n=1 Tax=Sphingomonas paeninsulae TaxID=2319844 RepID=UPI001EEFCEA4|nr:hypothetical protein [Sphingomonas paeninsulae]
MLIGLAFNFANANANANADARLHAGLLGKKGASQAQLTLVPVAVSVASAIAMSLYPVLAHSLHLTDK